MWEVGCTAFQEMLDSIDEVWRCQDPKVEFSCLYSPTMSLDSIQPLRHPPGFLIFKFSFFEESKMNPLRPSTLQIFHRLMKFFPSLSALIVSLNTEACTRQNPLRAYKENGGKFHNMLHQDNSFLFR